MGGTAAEPADAERVFKITKINEKFTIFDKLMEIFANFENSFQILSMFSDKIWSKIKEILGICISMSLGAPAPKLANLLKTEPKNNGKLQFLRILKKISRFFQNV